MVTWTVSEIDIGPKLSEAELWKPLGYVESETLPVCKYRDFVIVEFIHSISSGDCRNLDLHETGAGEPNCTDRS